MTLLLFSVKNLFAPVHILGISILELEFFEGPKSKILPRHWNLKDVMPGLRDNDEEDLLYFILNVLLVF